MARPPGLVRRNNVWAIRIRVPKDIVPILKHTEVGGSLKTTDPKVALRRFHIERLKYDQEFENARRRGLQPIAKNDRAKDDYDTLPEEELQRLSQLWLHDYEKKSNEAWKDARSSGINLVAICADLNQDETHLLHEQDRTEVEGYGEATEAKQETIALLKRHNLSLPSEQFETLRTLIARAMIESIRRYRTRSLGNTFSEPQDPLFTNVTAETLPLGLSRGPFTPQPKFSVVLEKLLQEKKGLSEITASTVMLYQRSARWFIEACGNRPIDKYSREDLIQFRSIMQETPSHANSRLQGMSLQKSVEYAQEHGLSPRSIKSLVNILSPVSSVFSYALERDMIAKNPAKNISPKKGTAPGKERQPFNIEELRTIFTAPLYTGCVDDLNNYQKTGPNRPRGARFWIPLISLYSGMRLNEICQLHLSDIEEIEGILCIRVTDLDKSGKMSGDKRLKTKNARRLIPIHPELMKIGFPAFVQERKKGSHPRLFPELTLTRLGTYSDPFQKWFRRFLESRGISREKSFHCFRHTFRDALRNADISIEKVNAICGWEESSGLAAHYGSGYKATILHEAIAKTGFPELDLHHLHETSQPVHPRRRRLNFNASD